MEQVDKNKIKLNYIENFVTKNSKGAILKSQVFIFNEFIFNELQLIN